MMPDKEQYAARYRAARDANDKYAEAVVLVEYILAQKQHQDPNISWESLPWLIQFWPVIGVLRKYAFTALAINPAISGLSGLIGSSKKEINAHLASECQPKSCYFAPEVTIDEVLEGIRAMDLPFPEKPILMKPDIGERAAGVKVIRDREEMAAYLEAMPVALIVQEYLADTKEYGLTCFYDRDLGSFVIGELVEKVIPSVTGDGKRTLAELIGLLDVTDAQRQKILAQFLPDELQATVDNGVVRSVVRAASISYGTRMAKVALAPEQIAALNRFVNRVLTDDRGHKMEGFYYGRFDIRVESLEQLCAGNGKVIELNGIGGIPLHVYEPHLTLQQKYDILIPHFQRLAEIGRMNIEEGVGQRVTMAYALLHVIKFVRATASQKTSVNTGVTDIRKARNELRRRNMNE